MYVILFYQEMLKLFEPPKLTFKTKKYTTNQRSKMAKEQKSHSLSLSYSEKGFCNVSFSQVFKISENIEDKTITERERRQTIFLKML